MSAPESGRHGSDLWWRRTTVRPGVRSFFGLSSNLPTEMKPFRLTDSTFDHVGGSILGGQNFCLQTYPKGRSWHGNKKHKTHNFQPFPSNPGNFSFLEKKFHVFDVYPVFNVSAGSVPLCCRNISQTQFVFLMFDFCLHCTTKTSNISYACKTIRLRVVDIGPSTLHHRKPI